MSDPVPETVASAQVDNSLTADLSRRIKRESEMVYNVRQRIIVIGRDRLTLVLTENKSRLVRVEVFIGVLALFVGLLLALLTADFQPALKVSATQWKTVFGIATIASGIWLAWETWRLWKRRLTIDGLVDCIESRSDRPLG
jgi:hypothetical protein